MTINIPLISIVIPTHNRKDKILETIQSAQRQTFTDYEIVVVDDGSTDGTYEYLSELNLPIILLKKENGGVSSARNFGIKHAKGKYIAFLDSDDSWQETKLRKQIDYLHTHPEFKIVYTDQYLNINGEILPQTRFDRNAPAHKMLYPAFVDHTPIHTSTVLLEKSVLDDVGIFNELLDVHEDSELWNRISEKYDFGFIEEPLGTYNWQTTDNHLTSENNKKKFFEYGRVYLDLYVKNKKRELTEKEKKAVQESKEMLEVGESNI